MIKKNIRGGGTGDDQEKMGAAQTGIESTEAILCFG